MGVLFTLGILGLIAVALVVVLGPMPAPSKENVPANRLLSWRIKANARTAGEMVIFLLEPEPNAVTIVNRPASTQAVLNESLDRARVRCVATTP
jgi:hypothetical protein